MTRSGWPRSSILSRPIHSSMLLPLQVAPSIWAPISQQTGTTTGVRGRSGTEAAVEAPLMNFSGILPPPPLCHRLDGYFFFLRAECPTRRAPQFQKGCPAFRRRSPDNPVERFIPARLTLPSFRRQTWY